MIKNRTLEPGIGSNHELESFKKEIKHLNHVIVMNEEHIKKIPELEKKLRNMKIKYENDIKALEESNKSLSKKCEEAQKSKVARYNSHEEDLDTVNVSRVSYV